MTAKVNLLPGTVRESNAASRQRLLAGVIVFVIIAGLAAATFLQRGVLNDAEAELADARTELAAAQQEVAELAIYADLEERLAATDTLLSSVLADEASLAGILQDIALVTPTEGAFTSMQLSFDHADPANIGTFTGNAEVLASHAPGVERYLLNLDRAAGFRNVYPGGSAIDEDDIATFPVTVHLGPEYRTERYSDGLPEVLR
jgi:Tfp pilus assembly protein PilN